MSLLIQSASRLARNLLKSPALYCSSRFSVPRHVTSYEGDGKSSANILNTDLDMGLMVDTISIIGFRLNNGTTVLGSFALFHRSVLSWNVQSAEHVTPESLSLFKVLEPKIDLLVMGLGVKDDVIKHASRVVKYCKEINLNVEVHTTEQACAAFNFMNYEGRNVAAVLIPPTKLKVPEADRISPYLQLEIPYY